MLDGKEASKEYVLKTVRDGEEITRLYEHTLGLDILTLPLRLLATYEGNLDFFTTVRASYIKGDELAHYSLGNRGNH